MQRCDEVNKHDIDITPEIKDEVTFLEEKVKKIKAKEAAGKQSSTSQVEKSANHTRAATCENDISAGNKKIQHINRKSVKILIDKKKASEHEECSANDSLIPHQSENYVSDKTEVLSSYVINSPTLTSLESGEVIEIDKPVFRIGKSSDFADYVLNAKHVSRRHLEINLKNSTCYIKDKDSTNGTYINNYKLPTDAEMEIKDGQILKIADKEYLFTMK